jgi:hypothetical protein
MLGLFSEVFSAESLWVRLYVDNKKGGGGVIHYGSDSIPTRTLDLLLLIVHETYGLSLVAEWVLMELLMLEGEPPLTIPT